MTGPHLRYQVPVLRMDSSYSPQVLTVSEHLVELIVPQHV